MTMISTKTGLRIAAITLCAATAHAEVAHIAVAANFAEPVKAIAAQLEKSTAHSVRISTGSSGKFYTQIKNGAPFDVLLSADQATPILLEKEGWAAHGTRFTYATGQLVLWSADAQRVDAQGAILRNPALGKIAIANPQLAPYGAAAVQALHRLGLTASLAPRWVMGENVGQTYSFVYSGNADVGFVALSQVMMAGQLRSGSVWVLPASLYAPLLQDAVLLKKGQSNAAALAFMDLLKTPAMQSLIRSYGYAP
jgi:molybdate transport system substrate-binding protein